MSQRFPAYVLIVSGVLLGLNSSAEAGGYIVQAYHAPVVVAPVYAPVQVVYPVAYPPIVQTSYYAPAPVYSYQPVYVAPAPVYLSPPTYVQQSTVVNRNRVAVRVKEYAPYTWGPTAKQVYTQRLTPHGVVIRHRGF